MAVVRADLGSFEDEERPVGIYVKLGAGTPLEWEVSVDGQGAGGGDDEAENKRKTPAPAQGDEEGKRRWRGGKERGWTGVQSRKTERRSGRERRGSPAKRPQDEFARFSR